MPLQKTTLTFSPGSFGSTEAEALYQNITQLHAEKNLTLLHLDMSAVNFIRPSGVLALITAARAWQRWTKQPTHILNVAPDVHAYLERIDLFTQCNGLILEDQSLSLAQRYSRSFESASVLEITSVSSQPEANETDVHQVIRRTTKILQARYGNSHPNFTILLSLISELATNVCHSQDLGYLMAQSYTDRAGSRVMVAISDAGIGIEKSLRAGVTIPRHKAKRLNNGSDYILFALEEGVSSRATAGGIGLHFIRQTVDTWNGSLTIRSASSKVEFQHSQDPIVQDDLPYISGTQVTITVQGMFGN